MLIRIVNWILFFLTLCLIWYALQSYFKKYAAFNENNKGIQKNDSILVASKSGRYVLPLNVQQSLHILDSLHAKNYFLFGTFSVTQPEFYQRIQESAWPLRIDTNSRILIGYSEEVSKVTNVKIIFRHDNFCMGIR